MVSREASCIYISIVLNSHIITAFVAKTGEEYRNMGLEYFMANAAQRVDLFKRHGVRYSELMRLPYFDGPRMAIIDPMHCLFLGKSRRHLT